MTTDTKSPVFVEAFDFDASIPNWRRVPPDQLEGRRVIRCSVPGCGKPCVVIDNHWPWMSSHCRCEEHRDIEKFVVED